MPSVPPRDSVERSPDLNELSDDQLLDLARGGASRAFGVLYARHRLVAGRLARHLAPRSEADDIVAEAFAQVWGQLRKGRGPELSFRSYLLTSVRHEAGRRAKARKKVVPTDDERQIDGVEPFRDIALEGYERETVQQAFAALPDRWREVLWHLEVKGSAPQDVAAALGMTSNGVSALGYRARAGLRRAYVQQHLSPSAPVTSEQCAVVRPLLAGFVRSTLSPRDHRKVEEHLAGCRLCARSLEESAKVSGEVDGAVDSSTGSAGPEGTKARGGGEQKPKEQDPKGRVAA